MVSHSRLKKNTASFSRCMEKTSLRLSDKQIFFVIWYSGNRLEFSLLSMLREQSFLRMKLSRTDYEFLCL